MSPWTQAKVDSQLNQRLKLVDFIFDYFLYSFGDIKITPKTDSLHYVQAPSTRNKLSISICWLIFHLNTNVVQPLPGGTKYILQNIMEKLNIISVY